jgi:murein DD-endopeptidase MepM/ murein hydrolase activator NlpD
MLVHRRRSVMNARLNGLLRAALFAGVLGTILLAANEPTRVSAIWDWPTELFGGNETSRPAGGSDAGPQASLDGSPAAVDNTFGAAGNRDRRHRADDVGHAAPAAETSAEAAPPPSSVPSVFDTAPIASVDTQQWQNSERIIAVRRGDTLMDILLSVGMSRAEAHEAVSALSSVFDPRALKPGQEITFTFAPGDGQPLVGAWLAARADRDVGLTREPGGKFVAQQRDKTLTLEPVRATGMIASSLYEAGLAAGVPVQIMAELIRAFSFDVDFQREIQPGDAFEVLFERFRGEDGKIAKEGALRYATLLLSGRRMAIYRYADREGTVDYYNEKGESVRKALLKTPIDGARLTSGFGSRMHPILGYSAFHKGVDFGAPTGTPIQAAGDGVIEMKGWFGGYGNYVRIRHNGEYATAYAHLSRFAPGVGEGTRVRQGQIIGYVGSTGRSTGPHLHYEVLRRGSQVNPMGVKFPTGRKLEGVDLLQFKHARVEIDRWLVTAQTTVRVATKPPEPRPAD